MSLEQYFRFNNKLIEPFVVRFETSFVHTRTLGSQNPDDAIFIYVLHTILFLTLISVKNRIGSARTTAPLQNTLSYVFLSFIPYIDKYLG